MLSKTKKKFDEFALNVDHMAFGIGFNRAMESLPARPDFVDKLDAVVSMVFTNFVARIVCKVIGHDLEDQGYGTPETGCIHVVCNRCCRTLAHVTLY